MIKCATIRIRGIVQGVNFRYHTQKTALSLGLKGYVKNLPDGDVLAEAQGEQEDLQKFIGWCNHGPSQAKVYNIEVDYKPTCNFTGFKIEF